MLKPVRHNGRVVIAILDKNREDMASMAYDRVYKLYDYNKLIDYIETDGADGIPVDENNMDRFFLHSELEVRATTELPFEEVNGLPPVRFNYKTYVDIEVAQLVVKSDWDFT